MHIFVKPCVKYQHLGSNALKWLGFSSGMESTQEKKYDSISKRLQYFSTLTTTQLNTLTVCNSAKILSKLHGILSEMLKKTQRASATNWLIKNY